jgi:hypothetical protein
MNCVIVCKYFQERLERDPEFVLKIITGDEMWLYRFDPETKKHLAQMRRPWSEFISVYGVVCYEFVSTRTNCKPTLLH